MRPKRPATTLQEASENATRVMTPVPVEIRLLRRIGSGTFGTVYQGKMGEEDVAVKRVTLDPQFMNRELEIMQLLAEKRHCNVIALKHYDVQETVCFFVMEKYTCSLADLIGEWARRRQGSPWKRKLYTYQLARGLAHIHGMGICHRDLKPQNVLVRPATGELVLCDFGTTACRPRHVGRHVDGQGQPIRRVDTHAARHV